MEEEDKKRIRRKFVKAISEIIKSEIGEMPQNYSEFKEWEEQKYKIVSFVSSLAMSESALIDTYNERGRGENNV